MNGQVELQARAMLHTSRSEWTQAREYLRKLVALEPGRAGPLDNLAACLSRIDLDQALALCARAEILEPCGGLRRHNIGNAFLRADRDREAVAILRSAVAIDPAVAETAYVHGQACLRVGDEATAIRWYRRALTVDPTKLWPYVELKRLGGLREDEREIHHLRAATAGLDRVRVVQVGAACGFNDDPLLDVALSDERWTGVLVEPNPYQRAPLIERLGDRRRLVVEAAAISDRRGSATFHAVRPDPDLPAWALGVSGFDLAVLKNAASRMGKRGLPVKRVEVECLPPADLLERHGLDGIDVLVIDTEGHDLVILRGFAPYLAGASLVIVERHNLSPADQAEAARLLADAGLRVFHLGENLVGRRARPGRDAS